MPHARHTNGTPWVPFFVKNMPLALDWQALSAIEFQLFASRVNQAAAFTFRRHACSRGSV
jgi:hypothetical protein